MSAPPITPPPHHRPDGRFRNPWPGSVEHGLGSILRWTIDRARNGTLGFRARGTPPSAVASCPALPRSNPDECRITWIGHSSFLIQVGGLNVLTDPVFSERASPVHFAGPRRLAPPGLALDALPPIDLVLQSHDHYDHFDTDTIRVLARRSASTVWCAPLGLAARLRELGVRSVTECDWLGFAEPVPGARVACVPARHFSGRSPTDRNSTLWCGWTLSAGAHRVYFVGDSAFHPDFAAIGEREGPFDAVLMPIGAYDPRWFMSAVHMNPEEAVAAFLALHSAHPSHQSVMAAMHWGTFALTDEPVDEPPRLARAAWERAALSPDTLWVFAPGETRVLGGYARASGKAGL
jgi:N-acyl-phosphatidylethanolamine-hydrolysing phospholipase D